VPVQELVERMIDVRYALGGINFQNEKIHPSIDDEDVISFADGNGSRRPHPSIFGKALESLLNTNKWSLDDYMFLSPHEALTEAVLADMRALGVARVSSSNIVVDVGSSHIFNAALEVAAEGGDTVLVPRSFYHELAGWCSSHDLELEVLPTTELTEYKLHPSTLAEAIVSLRKMGRRPGTLVIFNPTQTGAIYSPLEVRELALEAARHHLFIVEDCIFAGTEFPGQPAVVPVCADYDPDCDQFIIIRGVSKTHNLPNLRIGYAYGDRKTIAAIRRNVLDTLASVPWLNQSLAAAALAAPHPYLRENAHEYSARAGMIEYCINSIAADVGHRRQLDDCPIHVLHSPQAGHGILIKVAGDANSELGGTASVRIARSLLRTQKLGIGPASSLGFSGAGEARIGFASVGLKATYQYSAGPEALSMLQALAATVNQYDPPAGDLLAAAADRLTAVGIESNGSAAPMWLEGRRLIGVGMQRFQDYLLQVQAP